MTQKEVQEYCYYKSNKPDRNLINEELFQDFIDSSVKSQEDIQQNVDKLESELKSAKDKFFLWVWINQVRWFFTKLTC